MNDQAIEDPNPQKEPAQKSGSSKENQESTKKARQCSKRSVYKLNQRVTEAALIYFAIAKQKRFEGYLANFKLRL